MLRLISHNTSDYRQVVALRDRVLRKPLNLVFSESDLAAEADEIILADFQSDSPIATLQFRIEGQLWKMRQVAVDPSYQGAGVGSRLVRFSEDWAIRSGAQSIVLHARESAVPFYLRLGYKTVGDRFDEVGIPHFKMSKDLIKSGGYLTYRDSFPAELAFQLESRPLAILPWGALEWHGDHLPLGLDGIVAEEFSKRLAQRTGGVLFPTAYLPITTLPNPSSQDVRTETLRSVLQDTTRSLLRSGFKVALIVSGHYAQGHEWELYEAAERANRQGLKVLAASPLEVLEDDVLLDHAGRWETACLDMFRPDLVRSMALAGKDLKPKQHAVLGESPLKSDPIEGWEKMDLAWTRWSTYAAELLADRFEVTTEFYERRREAYRPYREAFFRDSWEQAIADWWTTKD